MSGRRSEASFSDRRDRDYGSRGPRYDDRYEERDFEYRHSRPPPEILEREREESRYREDSRVPAYVRNDAARPTSGPMVLRAQKREEFEYAPRRRSPPREEETTIIRRERDVSRPPPPPQERTTEEIVITRHENEPSSRHSTQSLGKPRSRERERSSVRRSRRGSDSEDELIIRREQREGRRGDRTQEEIIVRHRSNSSSSARSDPPMEPQIINAPQIHQEVITHHRHIDHGYEVSLPSRRPVSRPPSPPSPPPERSTERIAVHSSGERNGRSYHKDVIIDRHEGGYGPPPPPDFYDHVPPTHSYGPPRAWPDQRTRESDEIRVRHYSEGRRHNDEIDIRINHDEDEYGPPAPIRDDRGQIGGRYARARDPTDGLWTEITKDLVVKEAIIEMGYEFEETDDFYYIIAYLRYDDIVHLQGLSEDIRKDRRERVKQIEWENRVAPEPEEPPRKRLEIDGPPPRPRSPWTSENERYIEREIVYRGGRPPPPPGWKR